jgi:HEAT repeat protein
MREVVTSEAEVMYRVGAIQFLAEHGDQDAMPMLRQVIASQDEQQSVREAAERALVTITNGR